MTTDGPKRPSARPSARPPAAREPSAPPPKPSPASKPPAEGVTAASPGPAGARVSARRSAPPAPPSTPPQKSAVAAERPVASSKAARQKPGANKAASPKPAAQARPKAAVEPARTKPKAEASGAKAARKKAPAVESSEVGIEPAALPPKPSLAESTDVFSAVETDTPASQEAVAWAAAESDPQSAVARLALGSASDRSAQEAAQKGAQSLLSSDYYVRQYGAHGLRNLSAEVDEYGLDPHVEERARPWLETLCTRYFRLELQGAERVPKSGRALLVANRSGSLPWDGLMLRTALRMKRPELPPLRWLAEDSVIHAPFLGTFMNRLGAVRACPENAERLLGQDRLVAVFPEGAQGSQKLFRDRYRLQRFGRGGYVKLALKLNAPILPTAIIGAEEVNPLLARFSLSGARREAGDFLPITPTFPWLGPIGLLPAPVKWRVIVGEPVDLSGYGPEAADDALVVHRLNEQIRSILQSLVDQAQSSRKSVLFG